MGLWARILGRYGVGAIVGLLLSIGLPADVADAIKDDPEIVAAVSLAIGGLIEWLTTVARKRGWST